MREKGNFRLSHLVCALIFCATTFLYLYFYQADVLTVIQHMLSGGYTHYDRTIGAILVTFILYLIHLVVYGIARLNKRMHALTYFPSILLLTILTDGPQSPDSHLPLGGWTWIAPLLLVAFVMVVYLSKKIQPYEVAINSKGIFSQLMWINVLTMVLMFLFVGLFSNHDIVFHHKAKIEVYLQRDDLDKALSVGENSLKADSTLTMLRAYALARKGALAERLFEYPLVGGRQALLPGDRNIRPLMLSSKRILRFSKKKKVSKDYKLVGLLLEKKLKEFAEKHAQYSMSVDTLSGTQVPDTIGAAIPKHYGEALTIYYYDRQRPADFQDSVMMADYTDFLALKKKYGNQYPSKVRDKYGKTYWWYYFFQ